MRYLQQQINYTLRRLLEIGKQSWLVSIFFLLMMCSFAYRELIAEKSPNWDEASYLLEGALIRSSFDRSFIDGLTSVFLVNTTGRPPLLSWVAAAFIFESESYQVALSIVKMSIWVIWLVSINNLFKICLTKYGRYFALLIATSSNLALSIGHQFLTDLLVVAFVHFSIYFLILYCKEFKTSSFVFSTFFLAAGLYTKPTALILSFPLIVYLVSTQMPMKSWFEKGLFSIKFFSCSILVLSPWLILNARDLIGYGSKQISYPRYLYIYAPDNARSIPGIGEFLLLMLRQQGIVIWLAIALILIAFFNSRFKKKGGKSNFLPSGDTERNSLNVPLVAVLLMTPALYFQWNLLWETRYSLIFLSGISMILGFFWQKSISQERSGRLGIVLVMTVSLTSQQISNDPSKWSPNLKNVFYSNETRSRLSNFTINLIDNGRLPIVLNDVAVKSAKRLNAFITPHDKIGLGIAHPELNSFSLGWAQQTLGLRANQFIYLTHKTIGSKWFVEDKEINVLNRIFCSDYAILPLRRELTPVEWVDIVQFQNENYFDLEQTRQYFQSAPLLKFSASIPLGVASNNQQEYGLFKQRGKYEAQRNSCLYSAESFSQQITKK